MLYINLVGSIWKGMTVQAGPYKILATENYMTSSRCINLHDNLLPLILTVDCGNLTDPTNGSVHHTAGTTNGQTATYSCYTGYNLVGNSTRTCQASGNWSGSAPTCQGIRTYTRNMLI